MAEVPQTDEGWYMLHDFRAIEWDAWRNAPDHDRERAVRDAREYLEAHESAADADGEGTSAVFSIIGHKADLLIVHLRPTLDALSAAERNFEQTGFADFTTQPTSYVSVTEVSGYVSDDYFQDDGEVDEGLRRYIEGKLKPEIPDDEYISFYPMAKRRGETYNWYTLDFEDRAELMSEHGETGKGYAGDIKQIISSSVGFDDYEWGVTLFAADPTDIKDIVYEMRFDEATANYGEFGSFYTGRRFPPRDLLAFMNGEAVPAGEGSEGGHPHGGSDADHHQGDDGHHHGDDGHHHGDGDGDGHHHGGDDGGHHGDDAHGKDDADADEESIRGELADLDIYAGKPHGEDVYATVLYSEADTDDLFEEVDGLRGNFEHYDTHVKTAVYEAADRDRAAVVSIWETASAADTAAGFLSELPGIVERASEESGFGTMGMFYTVKPDSREDFVTKFDTVGDVLNETEGHIETDLMINEEDENDMFIASQWNAKEDAMGFFRSDEFQNTVEWGRDVLADRPRHVFLA
ncbi:heme-binding protein [Halonotius terrestris]|uniref:Heme-binding protein n=1 Tax=Halonotius terrestris TaxID=2487750 RepID=A0A8J8P909_9EURY|nr:heme-binding protein [Halonotius terrestris]TQQ83263.1 heme-binding protein [Halonotius terrestris]